jgi:hypothetical protein
MWRGNACKHAAIFTAPAALKLRHCQLLAQHALCHIRPLSNIGTLSHTVKPFLFCGTPIWQGPKQHFTVGPAFGQQAHYGHFDVIVGRNAQQEVWPHLTAFLEAHDAPASLRQLWGVRLLNEGEV